MRSRPECRGSVHTEYNQALLKNEPPPTYWHIGDMRLSFAPSSATTLSNDVRVVSGDLQNRISRAAVAQRQEPYWDRILIVAFSGGGRL